MGRGVGDGEGNLDSFGEGGELGNKERGIWEQGEGNLDSFAIIYWAAFAALGAVGF